MHIKFEEESREVVQRPNRNNTALPWFIAQQPALLFTDNSKYPDKFFLTLSVSNQQADAVNAKPFPAGDYGLTEQAFRVNRNRSAEVDFTKIVPLKS